MKRHNSKAIVTVASVFLLGIACIATRIGFAKADPEERSRIVRPAVMMDEDRDDRNFAPSSPSAIRLDFAIQRLRPDGRIETVRNPNRLRTGDRFRIMARGNHSGYLYLLNRGTSGRMAALYPERAMGFGENVLMRNEVSTIPSRGWFRLQPPSGVEHLTIVLSVEPIEGSYAGNEDSEDGDDGGWIESGDAVDQGDGLALDDDEDHEMDQWPSSPLGGRDITRPSPRVVRRFTITHRR